MALLTPYDLFEGWIALHRVSTHVPTRGMALHWVSSKFDTTITQHVGAKGVTFQVRGKGWGYTLIVSDGEVKLASKVGAFQDDDIDQIFTLARISR